MSESLNLCALQNQKVFFRAEGFNATACHQLVGSHVQCSFSSIQSNIRRQKCVFYEKNGVGEERLGLTVLVARQRFPQQIEGYIESHNVMFFLAEV